MLFTPKKKPPIWRRQAHRPAISCRVVHIDLKGPKISVEVFARYLETLARWGINGVLVEYEHRLPELPLPHQFPARDRYTREELRSLTELADSLGIEWIPLVQTFGHLEYLSRLKGTEFLFENPAYPSQLCPCRPGVRTYIKDLIDLVCELHPHSRKMCVGQDETAFLGFCPACRKRMKAFGGKTEFFLDHARWVWSLVLEKGWQPMFWADMVLNEGRLDLARKLDPRVIALPWDYDAVAPAACFLQWRGNRVSKKKFRHPYRAETTGTPLPIFVAPGRFVEDLPQRELELIGVAGDASGYPKSFAQIRALAKAGRSLWGACGVYTSSDMHFRPDFLRGTLNPASMCATLTELKGEGIIGTSWARGNSFSPIGAPWPTTLYTVAQFAANAWTGRTGPQDLQARSGAIAAELDMPEKIGGWSLDDLLWTVSCNSTMVGVSGKQATLSQVIERLRVARVSGFFGNALQVSLESEVLAYKLAFIEEEARWWYPNRNDLPAEILAEMKTRFKGFRKEEAALKTRARKYYTAFVGEAAAFETWWKGAVEVYIKRAQSALRLPVPS